METHVELIADALNLTLDAAKELYPVIRSQYVLHSGIGDVRNMLAVMMLAAFAIFIMSLVITLDDNDWEHSIALFFQKAVKRGLVATVIIFILITILSITGRILAPDYALLVKLLG